MRTFNDDTYEMEVLKDKLALHRDSLLDYLDQYRLSSENMESAQPWKREMYARSFAVTSAALPAILNDLGGLASAW